MSDGTITQPLSDAQEYERSVLGAILLNYEKYFDQAKPLRPEDFSIDSHRRIFHAMRTLAAVGAPIDSLTLPQELGQHKKLETVGGHAYLSGLIDGLPEHPSIGFYIRKVQEHAARVRIGKGAELIAKLAADGLSPTTLRAQLQQLERDAAEYETQDDTRINRIEDVPDVFGLSTEPISWLVDGLIPTGTMNVLAGDPGVGKSFLALDLARSITLGGNFLNRACRREQVLYLDRENPLPLVRQRLETIFGGPGLLAVWGNWLQDPPPLIGDARLLEFARSGAVIIFDSLIRFHSADENSASEMAAVMGHLRNLATAGGTVIVLHHKSKAENSAYRGSSDILGSPDAAFALSKRDGMLELRTTKVRFIADTTITIVPNFAAGRFDVTDSPATTQRRDSVAAIREVIETSPGITQTALIEQMGMGRTATCQLLRAREGTAWRSEQERERGPRRYFPIQCTEYSSVPGTRGTPAG